jgi:formate--tetrahydrofolate ligase
LELTDAVKDACKEKNDFKFLYPKEMKLRERVDKIAKVVYGADGVSWTP